MKQPSFGLQAARCLPLLLGAFSLFQCGPKRDFNSRGSAGNAGSGAATSSVGRGGSDVGNGGQPAGDSAETGGLGASGGSNGQPGAVGNRCAKDSDCALAHCVDGFCCESACTGCNACSSTATGKANGSCAPVIDGQDPHQACDDATGSNECGTDGACNGAGACRNISSSHVCKAASCSGTKFTPAATCDGLGVCKPAAVEDCGAAQCAATGCLKTCSAQTDCSATSYCKISSGTSGTCFAKNNNGVAATQTYECTSGIVADGVCCDQVCTGCKACSGSPQTNAVAGQCANVVAGQDPHDACTASGQICGLDGVCDGTGACRSTPKQGEPCTSPNLCLTATTCDAGACTGSAKICPAPGACKQAGVCAPATGCTYTNQDGNLCNDGNACTTYDKCTAGNCGGMLCPTTSNPSCSPSSHTCVCRIPDAGNVLKNPGFDGSASDWDSMGYAFALQDDSEACVESASYFAASGSSQGAPTQCVQITGGARYNFGVKYTSGGAPNDRFTVDYYSSTDCTGQPLGTGLNIVTVAGSETPWVTDQTGGTTPTDAHSARISSFIYLRGVDQIYFGLSPLNHF